MSAWIEGYILIVKVIDHVDVRNAVMFLFQFLSRCVH
jgi:hypothetical protein